MSPPPFPDGNRQQRLTAVRNALARGDAQEALAALGGDPLDAELLFYRAAAQRLAGRLDLALADLTKARRLAPGNPMVAVNLGALLVQRQSPDEALPHLEAAVAIAPQAPTAWSNLAAARMLLGDNRPARDAAERALALDHRDVAAQQVLAQALAVQGLREDAIAAAERAVELDPRRADSWRLLGEAWNAAKRSERAVEAYGKAHELAPNDAQIAGILLFHLQQLCRWEEAEGIARSLDATPPGADDPPGEPLLTAVSRTDDSRHHLTVASAWARQVVQRAGRPLPPISPRPKEKLVIGYLSGDLRDHAVGHLVAGLFAAHDRRNVEVKILSYGPEESSAVRRRIVAGADATIELGAASHRTAAERIRAEGVDILVELGGHTRGSRLEIPALRPAPVQVSWLGFPGTTGLPAIDYLVGDPVVTPPDEESLYSEKLIVLPRPYQANCRRPSEPPAKESRSDHGLADDALVLSSMNASYKLDPRFWAIWMRLLRALPNAVLWLFAPAEPARRLLLERAESAGVDPARLVFAGRLPHARHLGRLALANLTLDTRLYNGHTTTSDCLSMGVPVVAMRGRHFASRVSQSLLLGMGLPELIAEDEEGYEALALALAADSERRRDLQQRILAERESGSLFDEGDLARSLEDAYRTIWQRAVAGEAPTTLVMR